MTEETLQKSATKTCESCGKDFSCGANAGKCWCFEIDLSKETLAKLQEDFKSCLCEDCLASGKLLSVETDKSA
ncbi:MAG TPA: cysteine-rich CWC family protein [Pyrinomonadaceae bacterium]|jgi:hypothetical protein|nr:cysteine-rich CWC family protein [Pyrinomonadaceae bacterium]